MNPNPASRGGKGEDGGSHHVVGGSSLPVVAVVISVTPPKLLHPGWRWRQVFAPFLSTRGGEGGAHVSCLDVKARVGGGVRAILGLMRTGACRAQLRGVH